MFRPDNPGRDAAYSLVDVKQLSKQTAAKVGETDAPTYACVNDKRVACDSHSAPQTHYNGATVPAQEAGLTWSQPVYSFPSHRSIF